MADLSLAKRLASLGYRFTSQRIDLSGAKGNGERDPGLSIEQIEERMRQGFPVVGLKGGVKLANGHYSLTLDADWPGAMEQLEAADARLAATLRTEGSKPGHLLVETDMPVKGENIDTVDKKRAIDILGVGRLAVLPPSIHRKTGKPYRVVRDAPVQFIPWSELSAILLSICEKNSWVWKEQQRKMAELATSTKRTASEAEGIKAKLKLWDVCPSLKAGLQSCPLPGHVNGDKHPSLHVSKDGMLFNCFSKHGGGDIFTWLELSEGLKFQGALQKLAGMAGITLAKPIVPESVEKLARAGGLNLVSADDLMTMEFSEDNWIVEKLVPEGGITILGGKRSCNKTWFSLGAALAITRGEPFLGNFKTIQKKVVYIDAENGRSQIKKRLKMLTDAEQFPGLDFMFFPSLKLDEGNEELHACLSASPGSVVIIDSFRRVLGVDENDASAVNGMLVGALRPLVEECKATFILLHHLRKGSGRGVQDHLDELRGSSELVNYADSVVLMERLRTNPNIVTVRHAKSRTGVEVPPFRLEVVSDEENFGFNYLGSFEDTDTKPELAGKAIENWVFENKKTEFQTSEAKEALKLEFTSKSISRALAWLVNGGRLTKPSRGKYVVVANPLLNWNEPEAEGTTDTSTNIRPVVPPQQEGTTATRASAAAQNYAEQPLVVKGQKGQALYTDPSPVPKPRSDSIKVIKGGNIYGTK